ncbi:MAG: CBS domain-containing protein [Gemmatimonadota bacterium]|nr:CBS domain-containing protein [Gemmatimonadota bacterium]
MSTQAMDFLTDWTVTEIMEREVFTVSRSLPVARLAAELYERGITGAPVVDDAEKVVGVVSQSDVVRAVSGLIAKEGAADVKSGGFAMDDGPEGAVSAFFRGPDGETPAGAQALQRVPREALADQTVADIMMPARFSVRPSTTVAGLARYLVTAKVHRALVMEAGTLLGIVTTFDVLRAIASNDVVREPV